MTAIINVDGLPFIFLKMKFGYTTGNPGADLATPCKVFSLQVLRKDTKYSPMNYHQNTMSFVLGRNIVKGINYSINYLLRAFTGCF